MHVVVVQKFTFAISSPDEFLYYDLDTLAENAHYYLLSTVAAKLIASIICTQ